MNSYPQLIETFMHQAVPLSIDTKVQFEAIVASVFGTKQRRFGPMPDPEIQVAVRDIVREALWITPPRVTFFLPWGSRKQIDGHGLDVMEFMALKQLYCLQQELAKYSVESKFVFRLEDWTDRFLFGTAEGNEAQSQEYMHNFRLLATAMLGSKNVEVQQESMYVSWKCFLDSAASFAPIFFNYLQGSAGSETLKEIGWMGTLPAEQRAYYADAYRGYWPEKSAGDINWEMAKYFAATLSRVKNKATCAPQDKHLLIAFTHPVPGNPVSKTRLHYRTIPQRYTNNHRSPWIGKGYFLIDDKDQVVPKSAAINEKMDLVKNSITFGGAIIEADFMLTEWSPLHKEGSEQ